MQSDCIPGNSRKRKIWGIIKQGDKEMLIVKAKSVKDYLDRYYKKSRYTGRGEEYAKSLFESYQADYDKHGYVCTSHHDNLMGEFIAWPFYPN
jgi:hypothetical protein